LSIEVEEPGLIKGGELLMTLDEEAEASSRMADAKFVNDGFYKDEA
jgi:hypothetical protein